MRFKVTWDMFVACVAVESDEKSTCSYVFINRFIKSLWTDEQHQCKNKIKNHTRSLEQRLERSWRRARRSLYFSVFASVSKLVDRLIDICTSNEDVKHADRKLTGYYNLSGIRLTINNSYHPKSLITHKNGVQCPEEENTLPILFDE